MEQNEEMYESFARVYEMFMDNVPYDSWCAYIIEELKKEKIEDGLVLDLGCGTGTLTRMLADAGYDMIGVDASEEMLMEARDASYERGDNILYLLQDMREFELYGTVRAVVSVCDSLNYITSEEELCRVFKLVNNYLDPGGLFVFDMNTEYKYAELLGENNFCETREDSCFIWENYYDEAEKLNQYDLTLFIEEEDGRYERYEETHLQRAYSIERVKNLLEKAGMQVLGVYDAYTRNPVRTDSERVTFFAREKGK